MAQDKSQATTAKKDPEAEKEREVKEIATKINNLTPLGKAEVLNTLLTKKVGKQVNGFTEFLREQGIVGLAVGLVLGIQVKAVVDQFMASFVTPILGLILPGDEGSFAQKSFTLTIGGNDQKFVWGSFVISLLTLIIVAAIIYYAYKLLRLDKLAKKKD